MFTGIVQAVGTIEQCESRGGDKRLVIGAGELDLSDVAVGDSICVAGGTIEAESAGAASECGISSAGEFLNSFASGMHRMP